MMKLLMKNFLVKMIVMKKFLQRIKIMIMEIVLINDAIIPTRASKRSAGVD